MIIVYKNIYFYYLLEHYNIISKVGDTFGIIGDYGMKLANKADSTFDIANKAKPLFNTTPVKIFTTVVSHIGVYIKIYIFIGYGIRSLSSC